MRIVALFILAGLHLHAADSKQTIVPDHHHPVLSHPADAWELTLESGYTWNVGSNTPIDYEIVPTQLTLRSPTHITWWEDENGARLVVRGRYSLMMETITVGLGWKF